MMADQMCDSEKVLTEDVRHSLNIQNSRLVSDYKAQSLELNAKKHWDLFYKRNENRFFKDRHWTTREFVELVGDSFDCEDKKILLEIGCGAGNLIFPLIEEKRNFFIYACDLSPRAVDIIKSNSLYIESSMYAFQCDITTDEILSVIETNSVDIISIVFVLSAIHPNKFRNVINVVYKLLKPGGIVLFRDYGLYDMAQLRFKPGHKIADNFYMRQDGTRSYYFSKDEVSALFATNEFEMISNGYIHRRTINKKEGIDVPRIFIQAKYRKL